MRGEASTQGLMFSYVSLEDRIPAEHPLRGIQELVKEALERLSPDFDALYSKTGRPSIPPEQLLRALLLQVLFTIRSERQLMEQLDYNLLYRWFVGLGMEDSVWDPTVFTKNRQRLLEGEIAERFFAVVLELAAERDLLSGEHFTVDGTLVEAWASLKSFRPKGEKPKDREPPDDPGNATVSFHGKQRRNQTHASTTDPEAKLYRKGSGKEARLCYMGHVVSENRNGLIVNTRVTQATGTAERDAAEEMALEFRGTHRVTLGADKAYDTRAHVARLRLANVTPHVACNTSGRNSAIDERTTRHPGYEISQRARRIGEQIFGWMKTVGGIRRTRHRGQGKVGWTFTFVAAAYNLIRMRNLEGARA